MHSEGGGVENLNVVIKTVLSWEELQCGIGEDITYSTSVLRQCET